MSEDTDKDKDVEDEEEDKEDEEEEEVFWWCKVSCDKSCLMMKLVLWCFVFSRQILLVCMISWLKWNCSLPGFLEPGKKGRMPTAWRREARKCGREKWNLLFRFLKTLEKETRKPYHRSNNMCSSSVIQIDCCDPTRDESGLVQILSCSQIFRRTNYAILDFPCNWISCKWNSI